MDRFDLMVFSHTWIEPGGRIYFSEVRKRLAELEDFRLRRGDLREEVPDHLRELNIGFRRRNSILRLARGLADMEGSLKIRERHFSAASDRALAPSNQLREVLA